MELKISKSDDVVLIDDEDYEMLSQYFWNPDNRGYVKTNIKTDNGYTTKRVHQFLINTPKGMHTDHIDGDKLNNQKENLRVTTPSQNQMNTSKRKNMTSEYKGVSKIGKRWRADIMFNYKQIYLGIFTFEKDAAIAYNNKAIELFKKYARLNEV